MFKSLSFQLSPISLFCLISHFYLLFLLTWHISLFIWTFYFVWSINNAVIVSSEQQSDSPIPKKIVLKSSSRFIAKLRGRHRDFPHLSYSHMYSPSPLPDINILYQSGTFIQFSSVAQSCLTLWDPMDCSTSGLPVHHQLPDLAQTHVQVSDAIQPSHPLLSLFPPAFNLSQHQGVF